MVVSTASWTPSNRGSSSTATSSLSSQQRSPERIPSCPTFLRAQAARDGHKDRVGGHTSMGALSKEGVNGATREEASYCQPCHLLQVHTPLRSGLSPSATDRHDGGSKVLTLARSLRAEEAAFKHGVMRWPSSSWIKCSATAGCWWMFIGKQSAQLAQWADLARTALRSPRLPSDKGEVAESRVAGSH